MVPQLTGAGWWESGRITEWGHSDVHSSHVAGWGPFPRRVSACDLHVSIQSIQQPVTKRQPLFKFWGSIEDCPQLPEKLWVVSASQHPIPVNLCSHVSLPNSRVWPAGTETRVDPAAELRETFINLKANVPFFNNLFMLGKCHTHIHTQRSMCINVYINANINASIHKYVFTVIKCDEFMIIVFKLIHFSHFLLNSVGSGQELFIEELDPVTSSLTLEVWASCDVPKCTQTHRSVPISYLFFYIKKHLKYFMQYIFIVFFLPQLLQDLSTHTHWTLCYLSLSQNKSKSKQKTPRKQNKAQKTKTTKL